MMTSNTLQKKDRLSGKLSLFIFLSYIILAPFHFFPSGLPQIADYLFLFLFILVIFENKGRFAVENWVSNTVLGLALFVSYVIVLNLVWFAIDKNLKRLLFPAYYIFNLVVFYACFQMYRKYGRQFLKTTAFTVAISVFIQLLITLVSYQVRGKTTGFFNNPNQLAYFALLMGTIFAVNTRHTKVQGILQIIVYVCVCSIAILSLSRASIIGSGLLVLIVSLRKFRAFITLVGIFIIAYLVVQAIDSTIVDSLFNRIGMRMSNIGNARTDTLAGRGYDRIWLNPQYLIFGAGEGSLNNFKSLIADHELHSSLGTVVFSYGIPGTALFGYFIYRLVQSTKTWYLIFLIPTFIYGLTHQGLRFTELWILLSMVVIVSRHEETEEGKKAIVAGRQTKLVIIVNASWNVVNFRKNLVGSLQAAGNEVVVFAPEDKHSSRLDTEFHRIPLHAHSMNPVRDLLLFFRLVLLLYRIKPDVVLNFTVKPTIYGTIAAKLLGIPCVNNITGLGTLFLRGAVLRSIGFFLYGLVMSITERVFFQNPDDFQLFERYGLQRRKNVDILPGSGIDLKKFKPIATEQKPLSGNVFLFVGRLLPEKGIKDYLDAARIVKQRFPSTRFQVLGPENNEGKNSAVRIQLDRAMKEGVVDYLGTVEDVRPYIAKANCVVLPSYREGTPRSLLEAAAMGKPVIATDVPGCREVVEDGRNGYLCRFKDPEDLAKRMVGFTRLSASVREKMGRYGREKIERQFDEQIVIRKYLAVVDDLLTRRTTT